MENFKAQVVEVMKSFKDVLIQRGRQSSLPRQLLVFGSHWTSKLESFWEAYMVEPVLVITSQYEAAVFGGAKHFVTMIRAGERLARLVDLVGSVMEMNKKMIVFTDNEEEATTVYRTLSANSCYVLLATVGADFTLVLREWHLPHKGTSCPVLVCTDAVVFDLGITDADVVMHYGMASSKTRFGNRLSCAQDNYRNSASLKDKTNCPKSYIFVTENCGPMVMSLVDLLERTKCHIPKELRAMVQGMLEGKERDNPRPLCYYLKAFGTCKLRSHCLKRHVIRPELDKRRQLTMSSLLPSQGEVKVLVSYVENASCYYVRILQHRVLDGTIQQMDTVYNRLNDALQAWFSISENRFENGPVLYGDLCCYPEEERYCRVQIQDEGNVEHYATQRHKSVKIFYVDEGRTDKVTASSLLKLPDNFKGIPFQAVEAYLCRISPVDSDTDWVPKADAFMCSQVRDIELWGKIVLSLGGTLWLDPFVERVYHETIKVTTTNTQIRTLLIRRGYAIENPQHLELLYEACKDKMELPDYSRSVLDVEPEVESLPVALEDVSGEESSDTTTPVFISACGTPECFYLRLAERNQDREELMSRMNKDSSQQKVVLDEKKIKAGTLCLANFYIDDNWYRAKIVSVGNDDKVDVLFVDYGDTETMSVQDIREIPEKYLRLPFQAMECGLPDVAPVGSSWQEDDGDALWEMVCHHNGDFRELQAKVKGRRIAQCIGAHRHLVDLVYKSCDEEVNVLQEMVYHKHCQVDSTSIQPLFPLSVCGAESSGADKLPQRPVDLCRSIYNTQNPLVLRTMTLQLGNMLKSIVEDVSVEDEVKKEVISNLWKLIRYSQHATVVTTLLPLLTQSIRQCQSLLSSVLESRFVTHLCWQICRSKSSDVKLSCLRSLLILCHEEMVNVSLAKLENIEALLTTVKQSESIKVKTLTTELLARMCTALHSARTMANVKAEKGIDVVLKQVSLHKDDSEFAEAFCHFCCVLGDHQKEEYYTDFSKDGLLKLVVQLIRDTNNHQVIRWTTQLMHRLSERSRRNKTLMLEAEYVPVLKGLPQRFPELTLELSSQWNHLLTSLDVKAPREHLSGDMSMVVHEQLPMNTQRNLGISISPHVSWYQNSFRVVLSVKLTRVTKKSVMYNENSVHFRAVCDGKLYEFEFSLCDKIIPAKSHEEVRLKEVLISLKKEQKGRWKRLLRDKEKPSFLSIDFERIRDSSDSDGEDSDDNLFIVKHSTRGKPLPRKSSTRSATAKSVEENPGLNTSASSDSDDSLGNQNYDGDEFDFFDI
ncbi:putative ATP-dependent RNA helicase TDRD12 [Liolophura sinensis]|uniref:putative ATP-dependent RNA helicase TDRD12 n=1 Tax=Liolophura sinensis TaxID=3198878 RepID=UPI00315849CA